MMHKPLMVKKDRPVDRKLLSQNVPYRLLRITPACNAACRFCNVPVESCSFRRVTFAEAKKQIDRFILEDKNTRLDISGGEPTLSSDLPRLIAYAASGGIKAIQLQTNGILLAGKRFTKQLKRSGLSGAFVALHSASAGVHDFLVGRKGAFKACLKGIDNLLSCGIKVVLNPVLTAFSYRGLEEYLFFVKRSFPEIGNISLSVVQPHGRAAKNIGLLPRYGQIDPYVRRGLILSKDLGLLLINPYCGLPLCIGGWDKFLCQCVEYSINSLGAGSVESKAATDNNKIKGPRCLKCALGRYCNGVWRGYAAVYSFSELEPLS